MKKWFVYIVECKDNSYYTGITTDFKRRLFQHNNKLGAKSLFGRLPVKLVFKEEHKNQIEAAKREREIKSWNRKKKDNLVRG